MELSAFAPFGEREIRVDSTPSVVEQVRGAAGELVIEVSEEVSAQALAQALAAGDFRLVETAGETALGIEVAQPVDSGRQARRRLTVAPTAPPAAGAELRLVIEPAVLVDLFSNRPPEPFELTFPWPAANTILHDTTPPCLEQVLVRDGRLEIELSEEPDLMAAAAAIRVDGAAATWTVGADRYTLIAGEGLGQGSHQVEISTGPPLDLAGLGLAETFSGSVTLVSVAESLVVYQAADPRVVMASTVGNRYGFKGLPHDPETGFVYVRNRSYDPELGRFLTTDPMGYVDGPNLYQFALNSPVNYSDPLGLACTTRHGGTNQLCNPMDEMELSSATPWWEYAWAVAAQTGGNTLTEGLFLSVFADAPQVVLDPEASTGAKVVAGGKAGGAAVLNLGGVGVVVKAGLGRLAATRPVQWAAQRLSRSRFGQRVAGVLMEDVGVLWRRAFGQADEVVEGAGGRLVPRGTAGADDFVDLTSPARRRHILEGDVTGGGHRPGTGIPGKSEFPAGWSDDRIIHAISDVATDPGATRAAGRGGRTIVTGTRDGVEIRVVLEADGTIVTGFPTNVSRNP